MQPISPYSFITGVRIARSFYMTQSMRIILLFVLLSVASGAYAAELSITPAPAGAGATFSIPVMVDVGNDNVNAIEGSLTVPDGLVIDTISTAGSVLALWAEGPSYVVTDRAIEFTGGSPHSIASGKQLLFVVHAHAAAQGSYVLTPKSLSAYANDGKGSRLAITSAPVTVMVGAKGSVPAESGQSTPHTATTLVADLGRDASLFDGKYFIAFYGGDNGRGVDHYEIQEGWWSRAVRADKYYVVKDQSQGTSLYVTAINANGTVAVTTIPAAHPWKERGVLIALLLVLAVSILSIVNRFKVRHTRS